MKPIPKKMLIHTADLKSITHDIWQTETLSLISRLKNIRIEPCSKIVTDKQNKQLTLSAVMFYDCRNSYPQNINFVHGQKIVFNDKQYTIEVIEPLYDGTKLHHYELGLI